jgi:hypothetical protein
MSRKDDTLAEEIDKAAREWVESHQEMLTARVIALRARQRHDKAITTLRDVINRAIGKREG